MDWRLTGCCCCLDLRRGALAVAVAFAVLHALELFGCVVILALGERPFADLVPPQHLDAAVQAAAIGVGVALALALVSLAFDAVLVRGVTQDRHRLVLPWLVWTGIMLVLSTLADTFGLYSEVVAGNPLAILAALSLAMHAAFWYWYAVVVSHYCTLRAALHEFDMRQLPSDQQCAA